MNFFATYRFDTVAPTNIREVGDGTSNTPAFSPTKIREVGDGTSNTPAFSR